MPTLTFYRQVRADGGIRTGIETDGITLLGRFDPGSTSDDPSLVWYVDLVVDGPRVPRTPEPARQWLLRQAPAVAKLLDGMASKMAVGSDPGLPVRAAASLPGGARMTASCSAIRRVEARRLADILRDFSSGWTSYIEALTPAAV